MSRIPGFKNLDVWRKSIGLVRRVYEITRSYPADERFGLAAETRKTARSVPANIAEGKMRTSPREFHKFVSVAMGSLGELQTQIFLARELEYLDSETFETADREAEEIGRMLRGLERALARPPIA